MVAPWTSPTLASTEKCQEETRSTGEGGGYGSDMIKAILKDGLVFVVLPLVWDFTSTSLIYYPQKRVVS
jgi:hypothetical protein